MVEQKGRFADGGVVLEDFADEFLIVCPGCAKQAKVLIDTAETNSAEHKMFFPRKAVCTHCGFSKKWTKGTIASGETSDWYFGYPLWLQISSCGKMIWALNEKHLDFLENFVAAQLREQMPNKNQSLVSRLPDWIKSAKNRDEILKDIKILRGKITNG